MITHLEGLVLNIQGSQICSNYVKTSKQPKMSFSWRSEVHFSKNNLIINKFLIKFFSCIFLWFCLWISENCDVKVTHFFFSFFFLRLSRRLKTKLILFTFYFFLKLFIQQFSFVWFIFFTTNWIFWIKLSIFNKVSFTI